MIKWFLQKCLDDARNRASEDQGSLCVIILSKTPIEAHYLQEAIWFPVGTESKQVTYQSIEWAVGVNQRKGYEPKIKLKMLV